MEERKASGERRREEGEMTRQGLTAEGPGRSDEGDPWAPGPELALSECQWHTHVS